MKVTRAFEKYKTLVYESLRFGSVGAAATVVHLGVAWLAVRSVGMRPLAGNLVGYIPALILSYLGHAFWTFKRRGNHARSFAKFWVVSIGTFFLSILTILVMVSWQGWAIEWALLINLFVLPLSSWLLNRIWVFQPKDDPSAQHTN